MEKKIYTDHFERLLKEKSDEFRMYPSKRVWHSIYNDLHPGRKWPSIAMTMILVITLVLIGSLNTHDSSVNRSLITAAVRSDAGSNDIARNIRHTNSTSGIDQSTNTSTDIASLQNSNPENTNLTNPINGENDVVPNKGDNASSNFGVTSIDGSSSNENFSSATNPVTNGVAGRPEDVVQNMDNYIKSNQLYQDVNTLTKQQKVNGNDLSNAANAKNVQVTGVDPNAVENVNPSAVAANSELVKNDAQNKSLAANDKINSKNNPSLKNSSSIYSGTTDLLEQKAWMEDYAFHNKGHRAKWKDRADMEMWVTPSVGYRNWSNNTNEAAAMAYTANNASAAGKSVDQKPSLNLEAGVGIGYSFAKNMKLKMGVQMNYTSYGIRADQTNHPIATTLMLNDLSTGRPYLTTRTSTLSNSSGLQPITVHSTTYQVSVPVGLTVKLAGNEKMGWHAGATLQPSFVMGGMTNFISTDKSGYVSDATLLRRWNMSTGVETYLDYKMNGFSLQVGPQFRYQLFSTYTRKYTVNENLYNMGIKVGLVKNF